MYLIITGPPDLRKEKNRVYLDKIIEIVRISNKLFKNKIKIFLLGGIPEKYLPEIMRNSTAILGIFRNEGFGLFIPQSAIVKVPLIISSDPALKETTQNNACVLPLKKNEPWKSSENIAQLVVNYLSDKQRLTKNIKNLNKITVKNYNLDNILETYKELIATRKKN